MQLFLAIGRLGKEVEVKESRSGTAVFANSLAIDDSYKKDGEKVEKTTWLNIVAFGKTAELMGKYLKKGSKVFIEGKITVQSYESGGEKKYATKVQVSSVQFLDGKDSSGGKSESKKKEQPKEEDFLDDGGIADDDIPF